MRKSGDRSVEHPAKSPFNGRAWPANHGSRSRRSAFLPEALDDPDGGGEAAEATRSLISDVILKPGPKRGQVGIIDFTGSQQSNGSAKLEQTWLCLPVTKLEKTLVISARIRKYDAKWQHWKITTRTECHSVGISQ